MLLAAQQSRGLISTWCVHKIGPETWVHHFPLKDCDLQRKPGDHYAILVRCAL